MQTHWKQLANLDYIGAYALTPGTDLTVTIKSVAQRVVVGPGGKKKECIVCSLAGGLKPLVLNSTNSRSIEKLYGPYVEEWAGKQITLYASTTSMAGETVACLRIRPAGGAGRLPITDERFALALESIKAGNYTADKLCVSFELTAGQEAQLLPVESSPVGVLEAQSELPDSDAPRVSVLHHHAKD